jgi:hypothetical protein
VCVGIKKLTRAALYFILFFLSLSLRINRSNYGFDFMPTEACGNQRFFLASISAGFFLINVLGEQEEEESKLKGCCSNS